MPRGGDQGLVEIVVTPKALRAADEPKVELALRYGNIRDELGRVTLGVIHQISGMHLKESCEQRASRISKMRPRSILDLRKVGLADGFAQLFFDGADDFLLGHLAS